MKTSPLLLTLSLMAAYYSSPQCLRVLCAPRSALSVLNPFLPIVSASLVVAQPAAPLQPELQVGMQIPEWCRALPRPEYKSLQRVLPDDPWFEVYKVVPGVFAIYEPHQAEEVISYLIVGNKQALLVDTGTGIGDIRKVTSKLTSRPVVVLNSHTHNDHVGGNWEFTFVYGMDTEFTRTNAKGSRDDAQAEIAPDRQWTALHGRHLLSGPDLAVSPGNRSRCLRRLRKTACGTFTRIETRAGRAQHSGCATGCASETR